MNRDVLNPEIQQFITANVGRDISKLALSKNPFPEADWKEILNQVAAKTKAKEKLPTWFAAENVIYPEKVSVEQTSSEITALYKANLVSGEKLIDLTGGFGVDDFYFSKRMASVLHCEMNSVLSEIAKWNFRQLHIGNIECISGDSTEILKNFNRKWDWIYIDPSRRHDAKGKVFLLNDCFPNVPENLGLYFAFSNHLLIKTSPLLDISAGLSELKNVKAIHIIAVKNEVKELLWELEQNHSGMPVIYTVDISKDKQTDFSFTLHEHQDATYLLPANYLYEPNAAIMKSGGFDAVAFQFNAGKLHRHSHLYTSNNLIDNFPGRIFKINEVFPYQKTEMKKLATIEKANITTRNFPDSVETIRKKWKIEDGGDSFCFFTTDKNNDKIVLLCTKI